MNSPRRTAEAHPVRFRVSLFPLLLFGGFPGCRDDAHDLSGFDVREHVCEPEFRGEHYHGFLFCVICLIGVHLSWLRFLRGVGRRVSPPLGAGRVRLRCVVVNVHVNGACVSHTRRREARSRSRSRLPSVTAWRPAGWPAVCGAARRAARRRSAAGPCGAPVAAPDLDGPAGRGVGLEPVVDPAAGTVARGGQLADRDSLRAGVH